MPEPLLYPPVPKYPTGWDAWTLGELYQFVQQILWSPHNDDRQEGKGDVLRDISETLIREGWPGAQLHEKSRAKKIVFLERAQALALGRAHWTYQQLFNLWYVHAHQNPTASSILKDAYERSKQAARSLIPEPSSFGLVGLGALGALAALAKAGKLNWR